MSACFAQRKRSSAWPRKTRSRAIERLREFRDSARESLLQQFFSPAPVYKDLEQAKLADLIAFLVEERGGDDPLVQKVLAGKESLQRTAELVR